jgi:radical SAM superfamily enzyme YgiQ (UPF0313 family)
VEISMRVKTSESGRTFESTEGVNGQEDLRFLDANPTFDNPEWESIDFHVLIVRLSCLQDIQSSTPHLFLTQAVRQGVPQSYVDMAFFPDMRTRKLYEQNGLPLLIGLESRKPIEAFDLVLFSNAYILELINLPYLLLHSKIPLFSGNRDEKTPLLFLGGSNALVTQALINEDGDCLVDGIFFGEGEGEVAGMVRRCYELKGEPRRSRLEKLADSTPGLWISGSLRETVKKALYSSARPYVFPYPILYGTEAKTARLQITHGCPFSCAFCLEGYDRKPYREIPEEEVFEAAKRLKMFSGAETLDLASFNPSSHNQLIPILTRLNRLFCRVQLMSQRLDTLSDSPAMLEAQIIAGKRSFTFGVEGISNRQRAFLHKSLSMEQIQETLRKLLRERVREIKLFYILTGYEEEHDFREFTDFLDWLASEHRSTKSGTRIIFSANRLLRLPFTPLRYDRLFLEEREWRSIVERARSLCAGHGVEFRSLLPWGDYWCSQVLALGGYWLHRPLTALAARGPFFDRRLSPGAYRAFREWTETHRHLIQELSAEKPEHQPFPLEFVENAPAAQLLYRRYEKLKKSLNIHRTDKLERVRVRLNTGKFTPEYEPNSTGRAGSQVALKNLAAVMEKKKQNGTLYARIWLPRSVAGACPEWLNAWMMREMLATHPCLVDNLLTIRESIFYHDSNRERWRCWFGKTVIAIRGLELSSIKKVLEDTVATPGSGPATLTIEDFPELFQPGRFQWSQLVVCKPRASFSQAMDQFSDYLRSEHIPATVVRSGSGYNLVIAAKYWKKGIVFSGSVIESGDGWEAELIVGPKFDLSGLLKALAGRTQEAQLSVEIREVQL